MFSYITRSCEFSMTYNAHFNFNLFINLFINTFIMLGSTEIVFIFLHELRQTYLLLNIFIFQIFS